MVSEDLPVAGSVPDLSDDGKEARDQESADESTSPDQSHEPEMPFETTFPEGGPRAWSVAVGAAGVMFCTLGYSNAFGVYQEYYQTHQLLDQSPSNISWIGSLQIFFVFGGALFGGPLFDRFGAKVIWPSAAAFVFSVMMTSICKTYYQFLLAQGILGGLSAGMTMSPGMAATSQYFNKNRAAAMGIAVCGSSIGGVIFPIALAKMLGNPHISFGWTVRIIGFIMLAVLAPSCIGIRARLPSRKAKLFLPAAFKEAPYDALIFAAFLIMLGVFIPFFYLPSYAVAHGMSTELAYYLLSILNAASFFGRVIPGILADRLGRQNMFFVAATCVGILAICWQRVRTNASIIVFAVLYGFFSGAIISLMTVCLTTIPKDPRNIGTYMGMGMAVISFAALIGPPINGALLARYGGYDQVSTLSGVFILAGAMAVILVKYTAGQGLFAKN